MWCIVIDLTKQAGKYLSFNMRRNAGNVLSSLCSLSGWFQALVRVLRRSRFGLKYLVLLLQTRSRLFQCFLKMTHTFWCISGLQKHKLQNLSVENQTILCLECLDGLCFFLFVCFFKYKCMKNLRRWKKGWYNLNKTWENWIQNMSTVTQN